MPEKEAEAGDSSLLGGVQSGHFSVCRACLNFCFASVWDSASIIIVARHGVELMPCSANRQATIRLQLSFDLAAHKTDERRLVLGYRLFVAHNIVIVTAHDLVCNITVPSQLPVQFPQTRLCISYGSPSCPVSLDSQTEILNQNV